LNSKIKNDENLLSAIGAGNLPNLQQWLRLHPEVNAGTPIQDGWSLPHLAAQSGHLDIVQFLLKQDSSPRAYSINEFGCNLLHSAAHGGNEQVIELLLKTSLGTQMEINRRDRWGRTPLSQAVKLDRVSAARTLLNAGAEMVNGDVGNDSILDLALLGAGADMIRLLLQYGADVKEARLAVAAINDNADAAQALLHAGAELNQKNEKGQGPLFAAAEYGAIRFLDLLLKNEISVGEQDNDGNTVFHHIAPVFVEGVHDPIVKTLLRHGLKTDIRNHKKQLPRDLLNTSYLPFEVSA
jgi:ankyrin repeat protein